VTWCVAISDWIESPNNKSALERTRSDVGCIKDKYSPHGQFRILHRAQLRLLIRQLVLYE
jgi:hypothetical protein